MLEENDDISDNFGPHKDEKSTLKEQDIEEDDENLVDESSNTKNCIKDDLSGCIPQNGLLTSELSSSLREISFYKPEFPAAKPVLDIKYYYSDSQNNNPHYLFNDQLDYVLANYFGESETKKSNINIFLSHSLIVLLLQKLSYQNAYKKMEKISNILWAISNDEWINHKFQFQNGVGGMAR